MIDLRKISGIAVSVAIILVIITASTTAKPTNPLDAVWDAIKEVQQQVSDLIQQVSDLKNRLDKVEKILEQQWLVADWHFDEGTGNAAYDSSGNMHTGNINGATWVDGKFGKALSFDGVDDYVEIAPDSDFTPESNSWTIAVWVKANDIKSMEIVSWFRCGANPTCYIPDNPSYFLDINDVGKLRWIVGDSDAQGFEVFSHSPIDNNWHFITATLDTDMNSISLYVDGELSNTTSASTSTISSGTIQVPLEIGRVFRTGWASSGGYFNGIIDEIRIYNRALSPDEVRERYEHQP
jgi:archaellum component FlaG (FlaF/FlaG flagellin family)